MSFPLKFSKSDVIQQCYTVFGNTKVLMMQYYDTRAGVQNIDENRKTIAQSNLISNFGEMPCENYTPVAVTLQLYNEGK